MNFWYVKCIKFDQIKSKLISINLSESDWINELFEKRAQKYFVNATHNLQPDMLPGYSKLR